jgi:hypothetical protein
MACFRLLLGAAVTTEWLLMFATARELAASPHGEAAYTIL